jgi:hypothetical protein
VQGDYADGAPLAPRNGARLAPRSAHRGTWIELHEPLLLALLSAVADALRERELLHVIHNCEHLVDACADLADALLRTALTCAFWLQVVRYSASPAS